MILILKTGIRMEGGTLTQKAGKIELTSSGRQVNLNVTDSQSESQIIRRMDYFSKNFTLRSTTAHITSTFT